MDAETKTESYRPPKRVDPHENSLYLQIRGFPYEATKSEILAFLTITMDELEAYNDVCQINGKPCGEVFLLVKNEEVRDKCIQHHKKMYGDSNRYIDVFKTSPNYYTKRLNVTQQFDRSFDGCVRIRGLPLQENCQDLLETFFEGLS